MAKKNETEAAAVDTRREDRPRRSREEILEHKIRLAQERNTLQMQGNSPLGFTMHHILRQFDQAYARFKGRLGEIGGISHEEGEELMAEGREILMGFDALTQKICKKVNFRYIQPQILKDLKESSD